MFSLKNTVVFAVLLLALLFGVVFWWSFGWQPNYAVRNVSVVDVKSGEVLTGRTVIIKNGKISSVSDHSIKIPKRMNIIDGEDKFLAPGLADAHAHITSRIEPPLYVSYGVTTVRNMWGEKPHLLMRRYGRFAGIIAPRLVTAGPIIDGKPKIWPGSVEITSTEQAKNTVREQVDAGYDFIKIYNNLTLDQFDAIAAEADKLGVRFAGHVPRAVPIRYAAQSGMASIEHLSGVAPETISDEFLSAVLIGGKATAAVGQQLLSGSIDAYDVVDRQKTLELGQELSNAGVAMVPTLIIRRGVFLNRAARRELLARPEMQYVPPAMRRIWEGGGRMQQDRFTDEEWDGLNAMSAVNGAQTKTLKEAGVLILAGSASANPFVFHGLSLHEEMELLVAAGLSNLEAVQAATINIATFLDEEGEWGVVEEGAIADLVLLSENPLIDIASYRAIEGVMLRGHWYDADALEQMRAEAAEKFAAMGTENPINQRDQRRGGFAASND